MGLKSTNSAWIWNRNLKKIRSSPKCLSRARFGHPLYVFGDWHSNITSVRFGGQIEKQKKTFTLSSSASRFVYVLGTSCQIFWQTLHSVLRGIEESHFPVQDEFAGIEPTA
jgi:hypothetical protein